jgi:hypothetical protein
MRDFVNHGVLQRMYFQQWGEQYSLQRPAHWLKSYKEVLQIG